MWNNIKTETDAVDFMNIIDYFHDTCIKEMKYKSGAYVDENFAMYPINDCRTLSIVLQCQKRNMGMVELEFLGLKWLKLSPEEMGTCEILDATLIIKDNCIYWCDCGGLKLEDLMKHDRTAVCASNLRWRIVEKQMGNIDYFRADLT